MLIGFIFSCEFFIYEGPQVYPLMVLAAINAPVVWFCSWCFARVPPNITGSRGTLGPYVFLSCSIFGFLVSESLTTIGYMGYQTIMNLYSYWSGDTYDIQPAFEHFIAMVGATGYS